MRLLQMDADGAFSLDEYFSDIPRYAILSHRWGADNEEVTFKDLEEGTGKSKAGYRKLTFCGKQAANDGLQFFWIDTCCIDKASSAELSEAINSMFSWYQAAERCYVYLPDVPTSGSAGIDESFRRSSWFVRGWTLQELVAPVTVEFFSSDGDRIGDKSSLVQEINRITSIPVEALRGTPLDRFSVEERMSWTKNRVTKREEDAAYSLLGIFNVHMPLIYGEGKGNAFFRLRREIRESPSNAHLSTTKAEQFCITAIARRSEELDLFLCGPDGEVYSLLLKNGSNRSGSATEIGGDFPPGAKVTPISRDAGKLDIFACDIDGRISTSWWHAIGFIGWTPWWVSWCQVGEHFSGGTKVAAILRKGRVTHLFAQAEDGQIHTLQWTSDEGWSKDLRGQPLPRKEQGFPNGAHITVIARNEEHMNLFVCDGDGNIATVEWSSDAGWTSWKLIGQEFLAQTEITVIVRNENTLEIFACRPNGKICTTIWTADSGWQRTWNDISLGANINAQSKVAAAKLSPETTELFVLGSDGFIHTCWCSEIQPQWSAWELIGRWQFQGSVDVVAVVRPGSRSIDLLVSNNDGQGVTVWWTRGSKLNWENWRQLELPKIFKSQ
ncbi:heterokaryon incompatibility protein-domain-containing protein [Paraphoma chrysanthemicola]|uniref:Heterokaryon incompatibility protein-domain-containing protein n=1 Tax=Paraphoma chrysanthemicola TaxID=798071 RepID=A0A8K0R629_9PLEO|nr:heterokaryon incompatibility protein-domain-containing protein [Paraphoma chrysanthemicola]